MKLSVWIVLLALPLHGRVLACESDDQCPSGSSCNIELGYCSNPFRSGCLGVLARWKNKATPWDQQDDNMAYFNQRVCNSDDERNGNTNCRQADFDYPEVRIGPSYWDSSQVVSVLSILLVAMVAFSFHIHLISIIIIIDCMDISDYFIRSIWCPGHFGNQCG